MIDEKYSLKHIQFLGYEVPEALKAIIKRLENFSLIDLGCGDGSMIHALHRERLLKRAARIVGVDISDVRIERFKVFCPFAEAIVGDVCDLRRIPDNSFDLAISTQVIEHVEDDVEMLKEVYRIVKPNGYLYISTVVKGRIAFWIYWNKGFKLDPTHVREYGSEKEFIGLLEKCNFTVVHWSSKKLSYPLTELLMRGLIMLTPLKTSNILLLANKPRMKQIRIRVLGYKIIEALAKKD
ncbi:MAG: class I SAM-dependent methyltransferase [Candidatus Bathyarchaeia archaeon]